MESGLNFILSHHVLHNFFVGLMLKYLYPPCNQVFRIIAYWQVNVGGLQSRLKVILPCQVPSTILFIGLQLKYLYPLCNQIFRIIPY